MSDVGQRLFAQGFVRPSRRDVSLPAEAAARMPAPQIRPWTWSRPRPARPRWTQWTQAIQAR